MTVIKLYEAADASLNISAEFKRSRFLFGLAYTEAPFTQEVWMRMIAFHFWFVCLTFTNFSVREATKEEIERERRLRGRSVPGTSATRRYKKSGKGRRKGR